MLVLQPDFLSESAMTSPTVATLDNLQTFDRSIGVLFAVLATAICAADGGDTARITSDTADRHLSFRTPLNANRI